MVVIVGIRALFYFDDEKVRVGIAFVDYYVGEYGLALGVVCHHTSWIEVEPLRVVVIAIVFAVNIPTSKTHLYIATELMRDRSLIHIVLQKHAISLYEVS